MDDVEYLNKQLFDKKVQHINLRLWTPKTSSRFEKHVIVLNSHQHGTICQKENIAGMIFHQNDLILHASFRMLSKINYLR